MKLKFKGKSAKTLKSTVQIAVITGVLIVVYFIGVNVGNGNINISTTNTTGLPAKLNYSAVNQLYTALRNNYDGKLTETQVLNGIMHGLANSTNDPYTEYFTKSEAQAFNDQLNNSISGIGAELGADSSGDIQIIAPINGTPAAKAGVKAGEIITSINGQSTAGMNVDTAVDKIRGNPGTKVTLGILNNGVASTVTIVRANITVPSVTMKMLPGDIGYMQISDFADDTSGLAKTYAEQFSKDKVKGIILDLRDDPGGLLTAAINVSSLWLPSNDLILQEKTEGTVVNTYYANGDDILDGIPTVVLINGGSASAAEITTGALHDNKAAYVIGTKSYGKGVVQELIDLMGGAVLKVTVASWYRPDGQNINHKGITPDETVNITSAESAAGNDTQLTAAENYLANH